MQINSRDLFWGVFFTANSVTALARDHSHKAAWTSCERKHVRGRKWVGQEQGWDWNVEFCFPTLTAQFSKSPPRIAGHVPPTAALGWIQNHGMWFSHPKRQSMSNAMQHGVPQHAKGQHAKGQHSEAPKAVNGSTFIAWKVSTHGRPLFFQPNNNVSKDCDLCVWCFLCFTFLPPKMPLRGCRMENWKADESWTCCGLYDWCFVKTAAGKNTW